MSSSLRSRHDAETSRESDILDVATTLLVDHGFAGLTYEALAKRAHVGKATLYARWPGKPELVVDALQREHERDPEPSIDTGALRSDLIALCGSFMADRERSARLLLALATAVQSDPVVADAVHRHLAPRFRERCRGILDAAIQRGELTARVHDLPYALDLLPALLATSLLLSPATRMVPEDVVDHVLLPVLTQP